MVLIQQKIEDHEINSRFFFYRNVMTTYSDKILSVFFFV